MKVHGLLEKIKELEAEVEFHKSQNHHLNECWKVMPGKFKPILWGLLYVKRPAN